MLLEADAVKMDLSVWSIREKPVLCINDVHEFKRPAIKAVHMWNDFLNQTKWHIGVSANTCNIKLIEMDLEDSYGDAVCFSSGCEIRVNISYNRTQTDKTRTVAHELGHIFSLGHYPYPETSKEALYFGACNSSIMWMRGDCYPLEFPIELKHALQCRHYIDGFGGVLNQKCGVLNQRDDGTWVYTLYFGDIK